MLLKFGTTFINLAQVAYIETRASDDSTIDVTWHDGGAHRFTDGRAKDIDEQCGAIVPAAAGFKLQEQDSADTLPVVAFHVAAGRAIPVTPFGEPKSDTWSLLLPDGGSLDAAGTMTPATRSKAAKPAAQAAE